MNFLELFYIVVFKIVRWWRCLRTFNHRFSFSIISVGNLTVGGTGKSVVTDFLASMLGKEYCTVVLRGYRGKLSGRKPVVVSDGITLFCNPDAAGDEAVMHAQRGLTTVICTNRAQACLLVEKLFASKVRYVLLDDAYQNHAVCKDFEILLLDARKPFDNGHCLPVGRLREKDYTRAHAIILTHADLITDYELKKLYGIFSQQPTFAGAHIFDGVWCEGQRLLTKQELLAARFLLATGVGSSSGVHATAAQGGVCFEKEVVFSNHHAYTRADIERLCELVNAIGLRGVVVTSKDWVKIDPLLDKAHRGLFFVVRVRFEFLSEREYADFSTLMHQKLQVRALHKKESGCTPFLCAMALLYCVHFF